MSEIFLFISLLSIKIIIYENNMLENGIGVSFHRLIC